jgi:hypothetical protein
MNGVLDVLCEVDDDFARFFRSLGYTVTWDFDRRRTEYWYEILDGEHMVCQVDYGVPLAHFLEDLPALAEDRRGTSASNYTVSCSPSEASRMRELARRALEYPQGKRDQKPRR